MKLWIALTAVAGIWLPSAPAQNVAKTQAQTATVTVDVSRLENRISPRMDATFVEMMAEDVKWGMRAPLWKRTTQMARPVPRQRWTP